MPFEKGRSKSGGRKPGSANKATTDIKSKISNLIDQQFETVVSDLDLLEPKDRIAAYLKFLDFVIPRQKETKIDLSSLSDTELDQLLDKVLNKID